MARVRDGASPTPEQILRGAKEAFLAHGYELATMDKIAEYAGVARASVYNHFSSKEALFTDLMQTGCREFVAHATRTDTDLQEPLTELRSTAVQFLTDACQPGNINFYRLVIAESARFPWLAEAFYNSGPLQVKHRFEALLERARATRVADIRDPLCTADQLLGVLLGGFYLRRVLKLPGDTLDSSSIESIVVDAVDVLVPVPGGQRIASSPGFDRKLHHRAPLKNTAARIRRSRSGEGAHDDGRAQAR